MIKGALTIIFDYPFYKAIFERTDGSEYYVAQVNLGTSMPHMPQILNMVNFKFSKLVLKNKKNIMSIQNELKD